ncbi:hypothetical protein MNBD_GAMMA09-255 [hydrothermal vent metagenome]|uniref:Uncharacterized protein n=1 Tax=hydrothermal vent metagenome TaxID=652676 RepID=A0A3B0XEB3_9ZZZZ
MKVILSFLIFAFILPVFAGEAKPVKISPETTLSAIKSYKAAPLAVAAAGSLATVLDFADQSKDISVDIRQEYFPWSLGKIEPKFESKFIGAFVAGNVEYQLINKVNKNTPVEGVKLILYTYEKLREKNMFPKDEKFEKWLAWKEKGVLSNKLKI